MYLEHGTPGGGRRLDALLVGSGPGGLLGLVVVELKQWQACRVLDAERVLRRDGLVTAHLVFQVAAYRSFFQHWGPPTRRSWGCGRWWCCTTRTRRKQPHCASPPLRSLTSLS
ncbi:hypothetical protein [Streptomyces sp. NBC_00233]|uniref:hypothetical protein n=1 Tax=Streptomyces sp. NBC_00233 TaxID=2975686 RepID=UPI00225BA890|nr:hypothetical protein [Streptomyces sp. NBC_00233]MCX5233059.1 hypothetical protein [Streptomyces sp. NBC_00233]